MINSFQAIRSYTKKTLWYLFRTFLPMLFLLQEIEFEFKEPFFKCLKF